jgi:hypothetical protein
MIHVSVLEYADLQSGAATGFAVIEILNAVVAAVTLAQQARSIVRRGNQHATKAMWGTDPVGLL